MTDTIKDQATIGAFVYDYTHSQDPEARERALRVCASLAERCARTAAPGDQEVARDMLAWVKSKPEWARIQQGTVLQRLEAVVRGTSPDSLEELLKNAELALRDNQLALYLWNICFERGNVEHARLVGATLSKIPLQVTSPGVRAVVQTILTLPEAGVVSALLEILVDFLGTPGLARWPHFLDDFFEPTYFRLLQHHPAAAPAFRERCRDRLRGEFTLAAPPAAEAPAKKEAVVKKEEVVKKGPLVKKREMQDRGAAKKPKREEHSIEYLRRKFREEGVATKDCASVGDVRNALRGLFSHQTPPPAYLATSDVTRLVTQAFGTAAAELERVGLTDRYKIVRRDK